MVYVRQIPPEEQFVSFSDYFDLKAEGIIIEGSKHTRGFNDELVEEADKLHDDLECGYEDEAGYYMLTDEQLDELRDIHDMDEFKAEFISMRLGREYRRFTLRGYCQGDYAEAYLPKDSTREFVSEIETVLFNNGTEVEIHSGDGEVNGPDDVDGYFSYIPEGDIDKVIDRVAEMEGVKREDVKMYVFDGYRRIAKYREA